ncbi:hypothetical protein Sjap_014283 [Stephania japonica]|uniref:HIG1 domain-containing protein n=1 Tax=Stephania japonica TaxID=461633 RepID=A0AAP0J233_9MAGN
MDSLKSWVSEHKLTSVGAMWASAVGVSLIHSRRRWPYKTSLRLIHARMHAQALTLAVLSGAAMMHFFEKNKTGEEAENAPQTNQL